jgi:hypothetical protein
MTEQELISWPTATGAFADPPTARRSPSGTLSASMYNNGHTDTGC